MPSLFLLVTNAAVNLSKIKVTKADSGFTNTYCVHWRLLGFEPRSGHVGFVVDKVALGQVFSDYFGFPCQFSFH
jgi:hypothetical protein